MRLDKYIWYILVVVFSAGAVWAGLLKLPSMEKILSCHETRISVMESNLNGKLDLILSKLERRSK